MRALAAFLCLFGTSATAQSAWETWDVDGNSYAGICTEAADETCVMVYCDAASDTPAIALVALGGWSVEMGSAESLVISIGGGEADVLNGTFTQAAGFGPEFFALAAPISGTHVDALKTKAGFALGPSSGGFEVFALTGSSAAINTALASSCE